MALTDVTIRDGHSTLKLISVGTWQPCLRHYTQRGAKSVQRVFRFVQMRYDRLANAEPMWST